MDINVNIRGEIRLPEIALLCKTISTRLSTTEAPIPAPAASAAPAAPVAPPVSDQTAAPTVPAAPAAPVAPSPAPTTPPQYSIDDIARAGAALAQQGPDKITALTGLLQQFDLQAVTQLRPDQIGPFVTALRGLGAQI